MKNRPLVIPEPQAHKELNPSLEVTLELYLVFKMNFGCYVL